MNAPVKRLIGQKITQRYKGVNHKGVDLRCVRFVGEAGNVPERAIQPIIAPEQMIVNRFGQDEWGWYLVTMPMESGYYELKFIHMKPLNKWMEKGIIIERGELVGYCEVSGLNKSLHLHYETWKTRSMHVNPVLYFDTMGFKYTFKRGA